MRKKKKSQIFTDRAEANRRNDMSNHTLPLYFLVRRRVKKKQPATVFVVINWQDKNIEQDISVHYRIFKLIFVWTNSE